MIPDLQKFQFINNKAIFFSNHHKICHKKVGNQIRGDGLDVHLLKIKFYTSKMF